MQYKLAHAIIADSKIPDEYGMWMIMSTQQLVCSSGDPPSVPAMLCTTAGACMLEQAFAAVFFY
jgi:hypothetical protein